MPSFRKLLHKLSATKWKWLWIALAGVPAIGLFYVQEMIAALIIFSVLFVGVSSLLLIIFLLDRASQQIVVWAEAGLTRVARWIVDAVRGLTARTVMAEAVPHRFRRDQREGEKS